MIPKYPSLAVKTARVIAEGSSLEPIKHVSNWCITPCGVCGSLDVVGLGHHPERNIMYCAEHNDSDR